MIDSVGRIVFPTSLFGCSDPVISNGPGPCLIHTSPAERGCIQEASFTGDSHSAFLPQIFYQDGTAEPRFMFGGLYIKHEGYADPCSCTPASLKFQISVLTNEQLLQAILQSTDPERKSAPEM